MARGPAWLAVQHNAISRSDQSLRSWNRCRSSARGVCWCCSAANPGGAGSLFATRPASAGLVVRTSVVSSINGRLTGWTAATRPTDWTATRTHREPGHASGGTLRRGALGTHHRGGPAAKANAELTGMSHACRPDRSRRMRDEADTRKRDRYARGEFGPSRELAGAGQGPSVCVKSSPLSWSGKSRAWARASTAQSPRLSSARSGLLPPRRRLARPARGVR